MRKSLALIVSFLAFVGHGQKLQLGKVTAAELEQKKHPTDTSAAAAVLFSKGFTTFKYDRKQDAFMAVHEVSMKIKIYKKEGLSFANFEIPYYIGYKNLRPENLFIEEAATYNLVANKVQRTKVGGSGIFKEKVNEYWKTASVVFPDVRIGSVIEIKYKIVSDNIQAFPTFRFQREIPVDFAEYKTEIPVNYQYKVISKGLFPIKMDAETRRGSQTYEDGYGNSERMEYTLNVITHQASNIPPMRDEDFVDNAANYQAALDYELEMIQFPNNPARKFSESWESLVKTIYKDEDFGGQLKRTDYFLDDLKRLVHDVESKQERLSKVFSYVQDRMNWNGRNGFFTRDGVAKAWENRTGNVAEINLILASMLTMAGIETYPVLISTVDNGVASFPNQSAFNYVIVASVIDGKRILMDATDKFCIPGLVPTKTLNWQGRLVKPDGNSQEIEMNNPSVSKRSYSVMCELAADGKLKGKSRLQHTDFAALDFRKKFSATNKESYLEYLETYFEGISIGSYNVQNEKRSAEPVIEAFEFESSKHSEAIGDKLYVDPLLFFTLRKSPFTSDERLMPVFFGYPKQTRYVISIKLPQGYAVESVPDPINLTTGENVATFKFACQESNGNISITATYETGLMLVNSQFYPNLQGFFKQLAEKESRKIVLKKA